MNHLEVTHIVKIKEYLTNSIEYSNRNRTKRGKKRNRVQKLTNGRNCCNDLSELELVEDSGLTSSIKTNHQNSHFLLGEKPTEKLRECQSHFSFSLWIPNFTVETSFQFIKQKQISKPKRRTTSNSTVPSANQQTVTSTTPDSTRSQTKPQKTAACKSKQIAQNNNNFNNKRIRSD